MPQTLSRKKQFLNVQGTSKTAKDVILDFYYQPNKNTFVGVEIKNTKKALSGGELEQLKRYADLVNNPNKYGYNNVQFEYIFSSKKVAEDSSAIIIQELGDRRVTIYYIDDFGKIQELI